MNVPQIHPLVALLVVPATLIGLTTLSKSGNKAVSSAPSKSNHDSAAGDRHLPRGEYIAREALTYRGRPYRFGGESPRGVDCSGLAVAVLRKWGKVLPHTSAGLFKNGVTIAKQLLQQGDLVFFRNTYRAGISHVGIYIGEGKFVHAANSRKGVIVTPLSAPYYAHRYAGARRIAPKEMVVANRPSPSG